MTRQQGVESTRFEGGKAPVLAYLGMAVELGELFAKASHAGFSHEQLIKLLEGQLEMERHLKNSHDADQRFR